MLRSIIVLSVATSIAGATTTATFCGPASGQGCETAADQMVFLDKGTNVSGGGGNIGSPSGSPIMVFNSDSTFIDLASGFATIKPTHGTSSFAGLDITVPGYTFTQLVFDVQLTPNATAGTAGPYPFTITGDSNGVTVLPIGNEADAADTDKEFSITAVGGSFNSVDIRAIGGFDELKHFEVAGVKSIVGVTPTPEPAGIGLVGLGLAFLGVFRRKMVR